MNTSSPSSRDTLEKYIPAVILDRFAREHASITEPVSDPIDCALLFADIKGFTALSERLAAIGPSGVEELTGIINAYFSPLVDALLDHGGDIVKFAGDALITIWSDEDAGSLRAAVQRAAEAALAVQEAVAGYTTPNGEALGLKIAISAGRLHGSHLGGERGRWEFVLAGAPLTSVGEAADQCGPGEVVLEADAHALVAEAVEVTLRDAGVALLERVLEPCPPQPHPHADFDAEFEDALWMYVPGAIRSRVQAGMDKQLGELRRITVVFATLPGHERGLPLAQSQALVRELQRTLYRHEGSLNKLSVDDKGVSLLAALGLPPFAHDDDPARGLRVGMEMQAIFGAHGLDSRIGVATGRAFCGVVGSPRRCEYTMMGDVVNLAARLMVSATDGLLCDQPTYTSAGEQFEFVTLEPLRLKGKSEPVPAYRPVAELAAAPEASQSQAMVGRRHERELIEARLRELGAGESSVLVIEGEAGIGKSRLLQEVHQLAGHDCILLSGAADAVERTTPYQAWRGVFSWLFGLDGVNDAEERRRRTLDALEGGGDQAEDWMRLAPLINPLARVELPDNDFTRDLTGEVRADNTHDLAVSLLAAQARAGQLLVTLEDSHWMDSASWALLRRVAREVHPAMLALATRPVAQLQQTAEYRELLTSPRCTQLTLDVLEPAEAIELVCQRLGVDALPREATEIIVQRAGGNPFFSEELAKSMVEADLIEIADGKARIAAGVDLAEAALPDTVQGAVTQRIDRLAPEPQLALKVASVIGRVFSYDMLRDVFPVPEIGVSLESHLESLIGFDVAELEAPRPNLAYIFKHIITQEVAYELMLFSQRRELHKAVAQWLEQTHQEDLSPYLPLLAHHWKQAEDAARAMDYFERAGDAALRSNASEEAAGFFREALALDAQAGEGARVPTARRARWEGGLGEACYALGDLAGAEQHLKASLALYGYRFPGSLLVMLGAQLRMAAVQAAHRLLPKFMTGRRSAERERLLEVARNDERVTQLNYMRNDSVGTLYGGLRAFNLAEAVGPSPELARTAANMSVIACICLVPALARVYEKLALKTLEGLADPGCRTYVLEVVGIYRLGNGDNEPALAHLDEAIETAVRLADHRHFEESSLARGSVYLRTGALPRAARQFDELFASGRRRNSLQVQLWGLGGRVDVDAYGEQDRARVEELARVREDSAGHPSVLRADRVWASGSLAAAWLQVGEEARALAAAREVCEDTDLLQMTAHYLLEGFAGAARVFLRLWAERPERRDELRKPARLMVAALRNLGITYPCARPHALLYKGELQACEGNSASAVKTWQRCVESSRTYENRCIGAEAHQQLARHTDAGESVRHEEAANALLSDASRDEQSA